MRADLMSLNRHFMEHGQPPCMPELTLTPCHCWL